MKPLAEEAQGQVATGGTHRTSNRSVDVANARAGPQKGERGDDCHGTGGGGDDDEQGEQL